MALGIGPPRAPPMNGLLYKNNTNSSSLSRIISLRRQWSSDEIVSNNFRDDIKNLIESFKRGNLKSGCLGTALKLLGEQGKLLTEIKNNNFEILDKRQLSDETVEYLNFLEYDKLFRCRFCYTHIDCLWCDFHRNHVYRYDRKINDSTYIKFLNTDMAVIMFVEEYYFYLSSANNKSDAKHVLKFLTDFETLTDIMQTCGFNVVESIDKNEYELMDID
ncbi:hypothetical protein [Parapoynx stagnalis nucleopolyhedrovirus]|uniref:Ac34 n=1 Tax=Parapoynx stagnalis nucleopolyhedrovirus TaxID=2993413 RepID=A0A9E8BWI1_9ABAC|nr:hypothetical protein [Parapoynx stagnalis nucleopolyhedrovirus]